MSDKGWVFPGGRAPMCYFITIAVPEKYTDELRRVVPRGFAVQPVANATVLSSLPSGYQTFLLVSGGCSCGLYQPEMSPSKNASDEEMRQKYARKGWSNFKIKRAIEQSVSSHARRESGFVGLQDDAVAILYRFAKKTPEFGVLVHWYEGRVDDERIEIGDSQRTDAAGLRDVVPGEDSWLWVSA